MTEKNLGNPGDQNATALPSLNQRPSFIRLNDPIARLPFLAHWLLSLAMLSTLPLGAFWLVEKLELWAALLPIVFLACLPAVQMYWVSSRRRLLDIGANTGWLMLIFVFLAVCAFNALDGFMRSGMLGAENTPTLNPTVGSLVMLPAVILHFVLLLRRGAAKPKAV